ncbi:MAG: amino acid ABC transporter ATP-binding protein [Clostridia bacterium]|nr:amino acid ABC transporter ATP-binding protein [Clostridia bacterium]
MLRVENLCKRFGSNEILRGIDFSVDEGQVVGVIGSSGSGKSTLLRCIDFLEKPDSGHITLMEQSFDVNRVTRDQILYMRRNTAMVFQQFYLFKYKTALENVMEGLLAVQKLSKTEARALAEKHLIDVGLADRMNYYPRQLSGGQQQRVAIARALALNPKVLLLDEPTSALDPEMVGEVLDVIRRVADQGKTMVIVSHEMSFVAQISDEVLFMDEGVIVERGAPKDIFHNAQQERTRKFLERIHSTAL